MSSEQRSRRLWWQGLTLWYNGQDYLGAMHVWEQALQDSFEQEGSLAYFADIPAASRLSLVDSIEQGVNACEALSPSLVEELVFIAPLVLFLAGCFLDAGDTIKAQKWLARCVAVLQIELTRNNKQPLNEGINNHDERTRDLYIRVIRECISCVEEDKNQSEPWKESRRIIQHVLDHAVLQGTRGIKLPWKNAWQRPGYIHFIAGEQKPVYPSSQHPKWCRTLEENWEIVREDLERLLQQKGVPACNHDNDEAPNHWPVVGSAVHRGGAGAHDGSVVNSSQGGDWREIVIAGAGARPDLAPGTYRLLQQVCSDQALSLADAGGGEVIFSVLAPGTTIRPHTASTNIRLTAHLGLIVPTDGCCRIRIADEWCVWEPGKMLVFDDSYEHEVVNESKTIRAVLLLRFWHFDLPKSERNLALERAMQFKQDDELRRFNPPAPMSSPNENQAFGKRCMERTRCPHCWKQGYDSIRVDEDRCSVHCCCGEEIQ